jgi:hypothetical protein
MMRSTLETPGSKNPVPPKAEFQVLLNIAPMPDSDEDLMAVSDIALEAICAEADGLALGPVVSVNLDDRTVVLEITVEAVSASELHQKLGLISAALERGAPQLILAGSSTSRSPQRELIPA